jgi:hypothetical protein
MKIAKHFRVFLENHCYLQLPLLGRFEIVTVESRYSENGQHKKWLSFLPDNQQQPDPELINYLSQYLKVEPSITVSDLLDFVNHTRELLILGFETEIPGIGFLHLEKDNKIKFSGKSMYKDLTERIIKKKSSFLSSNFWL